MCPVEHFTVTIEGPGWQDFEIELLALPAEGEPIQTKYGTCLVTRAELVPGDDRYDGKIVCRTS
jgi:hypothetical protein